MKLIAPCHPRRTAPLAALALAITLPVSAAQHGLFTYAILGSAIEITDYPTNATGPVAIPATIDGLPVTSIGNNAFRDCEFITSVSIPENITRIGVSAFRGCDRIETMNLPADLQVLAEDAFYGCHSWSVDNLVIPEAITAISPGTFAYCRGVLHVSFHPQVASIGAGAFSGCDFTEVSVPPLVTVLGDRVFAGCRFLTEVTLPNGLASLGAESFQSCFALREIELPNALTTIGPGAFAQCGELQSVILPPSLLTIESGAFASCNKIPSLTIPRNVTEIASYAFSGCTRLATLDFEPGSKLRFIRHTAFATCIALTTVEIPASCFRIEAESFFYCRNLLSVAIGQRTSFIDSTAFLDCEALHTIQVDSLNAYYLGIDGILLNKSQTRIIKYPQAQTRTRYVMPPTVTHVSPFAFSHCALLEEVVSSPVLAVIEHDAFEVCRALRTINFPPSLTTIAERAFLGCGLQSIVLPSPTPALKSDALNTGSNYALFLGDAPVVSGDPFPTIYNPTAEFTIFFLRGSVGFTTPAWRGYPSVELDPDTQGRTVWELTYNLPPGLDLGEDLSGDGIPALMAYALNLNPNAHLSSRAPQPAIETDSLTLSFFAGRGELTYRAETTDDLAFWTTEGVTLSTLNPDNRRTASVARDGPTRYLRLVVSE